MRIALLPNVLSRAFREDRKLIDELWRTAQGKGTLLETQGVADLPEAMMDAREFGADTIVIAGGDGTVSQVTTALLRTWPHESLPDLYVLHCGTMNTISLSTGNRGTPVEQLQHLVSGGATGKTRRWPIQVGESRWGWLFGAGLIASYIEEYERGPEPTSPKKAARTLAAAVAAAFTGGELHDRLFARVHAEVVVDGHTWPIRDWLLLSAGGMHDLGLGFRPHMAVLENPEHFHMLGVGSTAARFAGDLLGIRLGRLPRRSLVFDAPATEVRLRADKAIRYNLDGELEVGTSTLTLRSGPALTFLLPPNAKPPGNNLGP